MGDEAEAEVEPEPELTPLEKAAKYPQVPQHIVVRFVEKDPTLSATAKKNASLNQKTPASIPPYSSTLTKKNIANSFRLTIG